MMKCRACGAPLVEGETWNRNRAKRNNRICCGCESAWQRAYRARPENAVRKKQAATKWRENNRVKIRLYNRKVSKRYTQLLARCRLKHLPCDLSFDEYALLLSQPCVYCGGPLPDTSVCLDQKVPGCGYNKDNAVPCCYTCNIVKNDRFTYEEMMNKIGPGIRMVREEREAQGKTLPAGRR